MNPELEDFIRHFSNEIEEGNAAIFAGAGLSMPAGYVDWKNLLNPHATALGLDIEKEHDLVTIAQYHVNDKAGIRHDLIQSIMNNFSQKIPTDNHKILARLQIGTYWTTNYDCLIERAIENQNKIPDIKYKLDHLAYTKHKRDAVIYKMHGDIDNPDTIVVTKDDYERYQYDRELFVTALSGDLVSKTFLFLGFSFTDPNLDYILSRIRVKLNNNQRKHYCIFKRRQKLPNESEADFRYAETKQQLAIADLKRFNINTLLIDHYHEITTLLRRIENIFRQKTVFISGSAHSYGKYGQQEAEKFMHKLSKELVENGIKVVSGFGIGVGSHIITGALEQIYIHQNSSFQDQLMLHPFPQGKDGEKQWDRYRNDMIAYAGIAIFIFGNKLIANQLEQADGIKKEFDIAKKLGLKVIPVGSTGFMAEILWEEVKKQFNEYYPNDNGIIKELFMTLGDSTKDLSAHVQIVIDIINKLNRM